MSWQVSDHLGKRDLETTANSMPKGVEPLITAYIQNPGDRQQFRDGNFTLTDSTGLTISPSVWPAGLFPGSETFLRITSNLDNRLAVAHVPNQLIQNHIGRACDRIAVKVDEALSRLDAVDQHIIAFRRTVHDSIEARHQFQLLQRTEVERLREAQLDARDREREFEKDRRERERELERDRRQRERDVTQDTTQGGRPFFTGPQDPAGPPNKDTAKVTDLSALTDQVKEIATTLQRPCVEVVVLDQSALACRRRKLRCLRYFACKTPL